MTMVEGDELQSFEVFVRQLGLNPPRFMLGSDVINLDAYSLSFVVHAEDGIPLSLLSEASQLIVDSVDEAIDTFAGRDEAIFVAEVRSGSVLLAVKFAGDVAIWCATEPEPAAAFLIWALNRRSRKRHRDAAPGAPPPLSTRWPEGLSTASLPADLAREAQRKPPALKFDSMAEPLINPNDLTAVSDFVRDVKESGTDGEVELHLELDGNGYLHLKLDL